MIRLFTAIEIPPATVDELARLQSGLPGARWIDRENFHITMRFIGEVPETVAADIDRALGQIEAAPFELRLAGVGQFGNRRPRAVWVGVPDCAALIALQARQERAMQRLGLEPEHRNYAPHVTIARLRDGDRRAVMRYIEANNLYESAAWTADHFVLFSSRLSKGGGPYVAERVYPLRRAGEA